MNSKQKMKLTYCTKQFLVSITQNVLEHGVFINQSCTELIEEMENYKVSLMNRQVIRNNGIWSDILFQLWWFNVFYTWIYGEKYKIGKEWDRAIVGRQQSNASLTDEQQIDYIAELRRWRTVKILEFLLTLDRN